MSIVYTLIAREDLNEEHNYEYTVLVEVSDMTGNFPQITRESVFPKIPKNRRSMFAYSHSYIFHIIHEDSFMYICLTEASFSKIKAQQLLEDIKQSFLKKFTPGERKNAFAYGLTDSFGHKLKDKVAQHTKEPKDQQIEDIKSNALAAIEISNQNIESIVDRGEKIELLVKKSTELNMEISNLRQRAEIIKEKNRVEYFKKGMIFIGSAFAVAYMVFFN